MPPREDVSNYFHFFRILGLNCHKYMKNSSPPQSASPKIMMPRHPFTHYLPADPVIFREAAFSSGGEECEWDAKQPTVGKSGDKAENEFSDFIPLAVPR